MTLKIAGKSIEVSDIESKNNLAKAVLVKKVQFHPKSYDNSKKKPDIIAIDYKDLYEVCGFSNSFFQMQLQFLLDPGRRLIIKFLAIKCLVQILAILIQKFFQIRNILISEYEGKQLQPYLSKIYTIRSENQKPVKNCPPKTKSSTKTT